MIEQHHSSKSPKEPKFPVQGFDPIGYQRFLQQEERRRKRMKASYELEDAIDGRIVCGLKALELRTKRNLLPHEEKSFLNDALTWADMDYALALGMEEVAYQNLRNI
jgi:hypothetical protein